MSKKSKHQSVLLKEALEFLNIKKGGRYIDATIGGGGHAEAILKAGGEVLGIDTDPNALAVAQRRLSACPGVFALARGNFAQLSVIASKEDFDKVDGILFDLGIASFQLDDPAYGLSFSKEGPLDMRLDPSLGVTAEDLVNGLSEKQLHELFSKVTKRINTRRVANAIVRARSVERITTTRQLAQIIEKGVGRRGKTHPATTIFMALRMAVNLELENLEQGLAQAVELLNKKGRLVVISFHSGEDAIIKGFLKEKQQSGELRVLTKKAVVPKIEEREANPRSRSAKLRAAERNENNGEEKEARSATKRKDKKPW